MTLITKNLSRQFIKDVKFPKAPRRTRAVTDEPPLELKQTDAQSLVVGSGLIAAAANVPVQTREDIINCTLFAQLAASGEVGDPTQVGQWYDAYFRTLTALGWAQSDTQFENYQFKSSDGDAHQAIIGVLSVLLGPAATALVVVKAALDALQSMNENSKWITLFDRESRTSTSARFQVATAQVDTNGLLQIALVAFHLEATSTLTQVLFFKFSSSSTSLNYAAGKASIYEAALKDQRRAIAGRLSAYRAAYVGQIKFPPPPDGRAGTRGPRRATAKARGGSRVGKAGRGSVLLHELRDLLKTR
jgi:hypothetical protein